MSPAEAARLLAGLAPRTHGAEPLHTLSLAALLALQEPGALSTMEVLAALDLPSVGTLSPYLRALQAAGYVERSRHPHDHRKTVCEITAKGRQLLRSARRPLTCVASEDRGSKDPQQ